MIHPLKKKLPVIRQMTAVFFLWLLIPVVFQKSVQAQTPQFGLSLTPSVVQFEVQPGKSVTQAFSVKNDSSLDLILTPSLQNFSSGGQNGETKLLGPSEFQGASLANSDLKLDQPFIIGAGQKRQLILNIQIDEAAHNRDWYLALVVTSEVDTNNTLILKNSESITQGTIAAPILLRVTNDNQPQLDWQIKLTLPPFIDSLQNIQFVPLVANNGSSFAIPEMTVTILHNNQILNESQGLPVRILANSQRYVPSQSPRQDDPRSYEGKPFSFNPLFALGKYTIRLSIANNSTGPLVVEKSVWAFPFSIIIALTILVVLLLILKKAMSNQKKVEF